MASCGIIAPNGTATSTGGEFVIGGDTIENISVSMPSSGDIDFGGFFISQIENLPLSVRFIVSQGTSGVVGSFRFDKDAGVDGFVSPFMPSPNWSQAVGFAKIRYLPSGNHLPIGVFSFSQDQTSIAVGAFRPTAAAVQRITIQDGNQTSRSLVGDVRIFAGENIRLRVGDNPNEIFIDAVDTSDLRDDCGCGDPAGEPIRQIGLVSPDSDGNINVTGDECLELRSSQNSLNLSNPCSQPCCGCETAEAITASLQPLSQQVDQIKDYGRELAYNRRGLTDLVKRLTNEV